MHSHAMIVVNKFPRDVTKQRESEDSSQSQEYGRRDLSTLPPYLLVKDLASEERYTVTKMIIEGEVKLKCECSFSHSFGLACCHIFAVLNLLQVKRLIKSPLGLALVRERWLKKANEYSEFAYGKLTTVDEGDAEKDNPYEIQLTT